MPENNVVSNNSSLSSIVLDTINLIKQLDNAKKNSNSPPKYFRSALRVVHGSVWTTLLFILLTPIPIVLICVGSTYLYDCTIQRFIPIWLIVSGSFGLLTLVIRISVNIVALIQSFRNNNNDETLELRFNPFTRIALVIEIFLFAWFICGNVWVYQISPTFDDSTLLSYCPMECYNLAYWIITLTYVFIPIAFIFYMFLIISIGLGYFSSIFSFFLK